MQHSSILDALSPWRGLETYIASEKEDDQNISLFFSPGDSIYLSTGRLRLYSLAAGARPFIKEVSQSWGEDDSIYSYLHSKVGNEPLWVGVGVASGGPLLGSVGKMAISLSMIR